MSSLFKYSIFSISQIFCNDLLFFHHKVGISKKVLPSQEKYLVKILSDSFFVIFLKHNEILILAIFLRFLFVRYINFPSNEPNIILNECGK